MTTVADFLRSKLGNMARWLSAEGCPVTVNPDDFNNVQITAFAVELKDRYATALQSRSFEPLLEDKTQHAPLLMMVSYVSKNAHLHDKFWRYMTLFSETVESHGGGPAGA